MNKKRYGIVLAFVIFVLLFAGILHSGPPELAYIENCNCNLLLTFDGTDNKARAKKYNDIGMDCYRQINLLQASRLFFCAVKYDPSNPYPHYNYACVLALFSAWTDSCEMRYHKTISEHLKAAIRLDPAWRDRMIGDPDFNSVTGSPFFKLLSIPPKSTAMEILTKHRWYGPKPGVLPASPVVDFLGNGSVEFQFIDPENTKEPWGKPIQGTFTIDKKNVIEIKFKDKKMGTWQGGLHYLFEKGVLEELYINVTKTSPGSDPPEEYNLSINDSPCEI